MLSYLIRTERSPQLAVPAVPGCEQPFSAENAQGASVMLQIVTLFKRMASNWKRDKLGLRVRTGQTIFFGVLTGLVYFNIPQYDDTYAGIQNRKGAIFFATLNQLFSAVLGVVLLFPLERKIFEREYDAGYYRIWTYFLTRVVFDSPVHFVFPVIFSSIFYWLVGLRSSGAAFGVFVGIICLVTQGAAGLGLMVGCLVPSADLAITVAPMMLIPMILVGGLLANNDALAGFVWLQYISPVYWGYQCIIVSEFQDRTFTFNQTYDDPHNLSGPPITVQRTVQGNDEIHNMSMDPTQMTRNIILLVVLSVSFRLCALFFLNMRVVVAQLKARRAAATLSNSNLALAAATRPPEKSAEMA